ncbi:unannotated protein [freshwater metagenome]|uniref:Unannotated protein n=1 Tax=freshwater metagenome TaxID=449393 RepID=A0A6J6YRU6_9ZZZZ|nr:hypothetical protein [Actinomycetota bacterium]
MKFVTFSAGSLVLNKVSKNLTKVAKKSLAFEEVNNWNFNELAQVAPEECALILQEFVLSNTGFGWWAWKPLLIDIEMQRASENDLILYMDAGNTFKKNLNLKEFTTSLELSKKYFDLVVTTVDGAGTRQFGSEEFKWTKPDVLNLLKKIEDQKTSQYAASWILIRKNKQTCSLIREWKELSFANKFENINENYGHAQKLNSHIAHRHDQSLFSVALKNSELVSKNKNRELEVAQNLLSSNIEVSRNRTPFDFKSSNLIILKIKQIFYYSYILENKIKKYKSYRKIIVLFYRLLKNS